MVVLLCADIVAACKTTFVTDLPSGSDLLAARCAFAQRARCNCNAFLMPAMLAPDSHFAMLYRERRCEKKRRKMSLWFWHYFHFLGTKGACSHTWTCRSAMCVQQATPVLPPMLASLTCSCGARQQDQRQDAVGAHAASSPPPPSPPCRHLCGLGRARHCRRRPSPPPPRRRAPVGVVVRVSTGDDPRPTLALLPLSPSRVRPARVAALCMGFAEGACSAAGLLPGTVVCADAIF